MSKNNHKDSVKQKISILHDRGSMLAKARQFFADRNVLEVDCPILSRAAPVETHIDLISALYAHNETCYLHSSPEYGMKRLLSQGIGDIYQLSHVFRDNESSHKHNPEFTMVEWYRVGMTFEDLIQETLDFIRVFLGDLPQTIITYREAFERYAGLDYLKATEKDLLDYIWMNNLPAYPNIEKEKKDDLLNLILGIVVEPQLGKDGLCALAYYPSTQAALAKTKHLGEEIVAERFEIYFKGLELCNGYHELTDPIEQRKRFNDSNVERIKLGKKRLPLDEDFLEALKNGLPESCGVAVGFDRLMMLRHNAKEIGEVLPIAWKNVTRPYFK